MNRDVGGGHFTVPAQPTQVVFGAGSLSTLGDELAVSVLSPVLLLCSNSGRELAHRLATELPDTVVGVFDESRMHVPRPTVEAARKTAASLGARACVAVGGGSAIGLAKALALEANLQYIAIPTTYSGSEMTPVWGITEGQTKTTGRAERVRPVSVLYDPDLTHSLPAGVSVTSGLNAIAHAAEALYAPDRSPLTDLMAQEAVRAMAAALPAVVADPTADGPRSAALYAAWLSGTCLGLTTMSLHHKLCHALGGSLDLPHAETHAVLLPHTLAFNLEEAPEARARMGQALGHDDPSTRLWQLNQELEVPASLRELGADPTGLATVREQALSAPYANPRRVSGDSLDRILTAAFNGEPPERLRPMA
ncbi:maleylacetate reductase [Streptomyces mayonensis]|uniref:maleylacetate reductase n=1 Tax=Streptomyces mayonensis TaxID=2750816 RepID=UPI001C1E8AC8|nr:maleylacetate reductase [Streptomyces sp. A108]MBU6529622.1 maleylacetate reductase [Streptomyces sp. A108]